MCDAWAIIATQNSLGSEPCKEELAYALDRALNTRGQTFSIISIFPASVDQELIPSAIKTRLYISLNDNDWVERIKSSLENRVPNIPRIQLKPYTIEFRKTQDGVNVIELGPRAGTWAPFFCAIPIDEKYKVVNKDFLRGPKGIIPMFSIVMENTGTSNDKKWWILQGAEAATPTVSYFIFCIELPTQIIFGVANGQPQYIVQIK